MTEQIIGRGAEAILIKEGNNLIKDRIKKSYRIEILDEKLRKQRTKKEAKLIEKASKLIPTPKIIKSNEKDKIEMSFIDGKKLSDNLDNLKNPEEICRQIGENIAKLHDSDIIHGDLTTSNMIYVENKTINKDNKKNELSIHIPNNQTEAGDVNNSSSQKGKVFFIDFGLGFESKKIEDKAVDLHLIKQALEAKHFNNYEKFFKAILEGYKISKNSKETLARLEKVEKRGRYKQAG